MRYKAFMSYCHADQSSAAWLHKALESYRVPRRLVGTEGLHGRVAKRLSPIFRDREELSSGTDLSEEIKQALAESEALLVICSPAAAASQWVNREIEQFRALGKDRIYCVIVDGDPQSREPGHSCFPPALLEGGPDGPTEPLAADIRKWADGKSLARIKLAAALLGVRLDDLRRREQQRKRRIRAFASIAVIASVVLLAFTVQSRLSEREAHLARAAHQASAEKMLASFLEQAERLRDVADLETRKTFQDVMTNYLAGLDANNLSRESRRQLGVVLSNRGVILRDEGHLSQAMDVFRNARGLLQTLVDESPQDLESLFELSQVEYWIGQVHMDFGQIREATPYFVTYSKISEKLHSIQPDNAGWTMEAAYARSNLGALERDSHPSDPLAVIDHFQAALELNEQASRMDDSYGRELADSHADLADAWMGVCDIEKATRHRIRTVDLAANYYRASPASNRLKLDYSHALSGLSGLQHYSGQLEPALENLELSVELQRELVNEDPGNMIRRWNLLRKMAAQAEVLDSIGNANASWEISLGTDADMRRFLAENQVSRVGYQVDFAVYLNQYANRAYRRGEKQKGDRLLDESIAILEKIAVRFPDNRSVLGKLVMVYFDYWEQHEATLPPHPIPGWSDWMSEESALTTCSDLGAASRHAVLAGEETKAREYAERLLEKGFYETKFLLYCNRYSLCETALNPIQAFPANP